MERKKYALRITDYALIIAFLCVTICGSFTQKVFAEETALEFESVSYTAPITLHWLAKAGVPEGVEFIGTLSAKNILDKVKVRDPERVEKANAVYQEMHYTALNEYIEKNGYKNVIDLGCGVSPRGIMLARKGINYVGIELPAVAEAVEEYAPMFLEDEELKHFRVAAADFTDREAMLAAVKDLDGPVCIVSELVLDFLSREKQDALFKNIHAILKEKGGCFITCDYTTGELFWDGTAAIYGEKPTRRIAEDTVKLYAEISETDFTGNVFETHEEAKAFVEAHGFNLQEVPVLDDASKLYSVQSLTDKQIKKLQKFAKSKLLWVMTAK